MLVNLKRKVYKSVLPSRILIEPGLLFGYDKKKILSLKNKFEGERCFIVGNGPSLNKLDLGKLKDEYSFGFNGIFYKTKDDGFIPTFYMVEDTAFLNDNIQEVNAYKANYKFFPSLYKRKVKRDNCTYFFNMNRSFYEESSEFFEFPQFSPNVAQRAFCGQSVTMISLQFAYFMGFKEVYLIGMDFSYTIPKEDSIKGNKITSAGDDINHFHKDYFGKGKVWHDPKLHNVLKYYKLAKTVYENDGRSIFNATAGGKLEVFPRLDYDTLFK
ncbi:6-hydroxymethylpterin diphosphokinase MptE-like protein [Roseivirga sp. UBA838]|uniref:6-hydroxymethylpterin diphosphokinase MptE-like protein n=1 Tax=Roseivirga sp. UBA838 TaxID=1947393 RepID=UPI00257A42CD|nr:6-hydroxymethylpterin diphosphokinase MptE-like protein [Roseivirga sp. UBA838]|tara:strand:+ start:60799 stop:61608 length:810 start_codon:yes stop_codon:yes gene_type:complete